MELNKIVEPLFQYVCMIRRLGENSVEYSFDKAKNDIVKLLEDIEHKAEQNRIVGLQYNTVKLPLVFFVDSMISESKINFASEWDTNRLSYDHGEMAGDQSFFDVLDEIFQDRVQSQKECLHIFYTCLGLGFTGIYKDDPKKVKQIMWKISDQIPELLKQNPEFIIEDSSGDSKHGRVPFFISFWKPKVFVVFIVVLLVVWVMSNVFLYVGASSKAEKLFKNIKIETLNKI